MTILDDVKSLPSKIASGFEKVGSEIVDTGENVVGKIKDFGEGAFDKTKDFIQGTMIPKLESIGGSGLNLAKDVKDKIVEGGKFMVNEGIPFVKNAGKSAVNTVVVLYWVISMVLLSYVFNLASKFYGIFIRRALPFPIVLGIMGLMGAIAAYVVLKLKRGIDKIAAMVN